MRTPHPSWASTNQGKTALLHDANKHLTFGRVQDDGQWEALLRVDGRTFLVAQGKADGLVAAQLAAEDALKSWLAAAQRELSSTEERRARTWGW